MSVLDIKKDYSKEEWDQKEEYYIQKISKLNILPNPSTIEVKKLLSEIDMLNDEAKIEYSYIKRNHIKYENMSKLANAEYFSVIKEQEPKASVDDVKGKVIQYLKENFIGQETEIIYDLINKYQWRLIFMEVVCGLLRDKKDSLVTDNGMMKLEREIK